MARAYDPENAEPVMQRLKNSDDAWRVDLALIRELTEQERQAEEDRALAAQLAGITLDKPPENIRKMAMLFDDYDDEDVVEDKTKKKRVHIEKKCTICMEFVKKKDPCAPCGHAYCLSCLQDLFKASMQDETLMPPRCCRQEIPIDLAELTFKEIQNFNAKRLEFSTTDRLYCSKPTCSAFIPPTCIINQIGTCPKIQCQTKTCALCKAANHEREDCPKDEATAAVLATAKEAGWTRCYRCRSMVELTLGCFHITCRCRGEFCYLCSVPWKNCTCPQWDETRLIEEARARTARIPHNVNIEQQIQRMANQLRANHECLHTRGWVYTPGGGQCDECDDYLPRYLYRCYTCHFMACNRCRRNRL